MATRATGARRLKAGLNFPLGLAADNGSLFIADTGNCRVRRVKNGIISTVIGDGTCASTGDGGPAKGAELAAPVSVVFDKAGNLYIGDSCQVRKVDHASGIITTVAGAGTCGFGGDGGPALSAKLNGNLADLAFDRAGNLFISDELNCVVRKIDLNQIITTVAGVPGTPGACGSPSSGDGGPATAAKIAPIGIALDSAGALYIADSCSVRKVDAGMINVVVGVTGTATTQNACGFSGDGGPASAAQLSVPQGLTIAGGTLYIADASNQRIRTVSLG